jgi:hypothetical protein
MILFIFVRIMILYNQKTLNKLDIVAHRGLEDEILENNFLLYSCKCACWMFSDTNASHVYWSSIYDIYLYINT